MVRKGEKQKGNQPKPGEAQPSILSFLTPTLAILSSAGANVGPTVIASDPIGEPSKKRPLDKGQEKISPAGKTLRLEDEVSTIPQPENRKTENRDEVYEKVVNIMKGLAPMVSDNGTPDHASFKALYQLVIYLTHVVFEDYSTVDRVVKENREIRESNQTMKYAQHCENLKKDMEKAQRTVKVLDMPVEDSLVSGKIENMNTARDSVRKTLKDKMNVTPDTLVGSTISINTRSIREGNTPVAIVASDKDKKISIEKALRAASKKVVVEWPSYLYSHIKEIRSGYTSSDSFKNKQILIRPSANNNKLVISSRTSSNERWNYIETLNFPLNPSDMSKFGQKRQPCKSSSDDVNFKFVNAKEYYKTIPESNIDLLSNSFQITKNGGQPSHAPKGPSPSTPTKNRFDVLCDE